MRTLSLGNFKLSLQRPLVMGIVNLTPDSFSGDGVVSDVRRAIAHAKFQMEMGADILDIGAESSRPGALPTPEDEELRRLLPVLREAATWGVPLSVDTYKPTVMEAALDAGASMINDIRALSDPKALRIVSQSNCAVCLMHMQGSPSCMQDSPVYDKVACEVSAYLQMALARCMDAGIAGDRIVLDPGFGFGKKLEHNIQLFRSLGKPIWGGQPLLVGLSRKSMLGEITGRPVGERMLASVTAAVLAAQRGAAIIRVHDVAETREALKVFSVLRDEEEVDES